MNIHGSPSLVLMLNLADITLDGARTVCTAVICLVEVSGGATADVASLNSTVWFAPEV